MLILRKKTMQPNEFQKVRNKLGYTQAQFAERLGYATRSMICQLEKGTKKISPRVAMLCDFMMREKNEQKTNN